MEETLQIKPSPYSLLVLFRDLGLYSSKDPVQWEGDSFRVLLFGSIFAVVEWEADGTMQGKIDFREINSITVEDVVEKFSRIGVDLKIEKSKFFKIGSFHLEARHLNRPVAIMKKEEIKKRKEEISRKKKERRQIDIAYSLRPYYR